MGNDAPNRELVAFHDEAVAVEVHMDALA